MPLLDLADLDIGMLFVFAIVVLAVHLTFILVVCKVFGLDLSESGQWHFEVDVQYLLHQVGITDLVAVTQQRGRRLGVEQGQGEALPVVPEYLQVLAGGMEDLEDALRHAHAARHRLIVTDGVFSMDGDLCPLDELCDLADEYDAMVLVDDSHATGFIGLQVHGIKKGTGPYQVRWKNIKIRELKPREKVE